MGIIEKPIAKVLMLKGEKGEQGDVSLQQLQNETNARISADSSLQNQINNLASSKPVVVNSVEEMTDTTEIYVNTTDNNWYYYNGTQWVIGGTYTSSLAEEKIDLLQKNLEEISTEKQYFGNIIYTSNFEKQQNESAIGYLYDVPQDWKYVKISSIYKIALVRQSKADLSQERIYWFNEYTFDHNNYYYKIYFMKVQEAPLDLDLYSELKIYGYSLNYSKTLQNEEAIKYANINLKEYPNTSDLWESGNYQADGSKNINPGAIRLKDTLPKNITYVKVNDAFHMAVTRISKKTGAIERLYWFNEYTFYNNLYDYKIHIASKNEEHLNYELDYKYVKFYTSENNIKDFIDNIDVDYEFDDSSSTYYSAIRIYKNKLDGTQQFPFVVAPNGTNPSDKSTYDFMLSNNDYVFAINSGLGNTNHIPDGIIIENSTVIQNVPSVYHDSCKPLTIDSNGDLSYANADADANDLVQNGIVSAVCGFMPIIIDYDEVPSSEWNNIEHYTQHAQRQIIGQYGNGDYAVITCEGRGYQNSVGWTIAEAQAVCKKLNLKFAYNLDGGGSTATIIGKKNLNIIYENNTGRIVPTFIVFNGKSTLN